MPNNNEEILERYYLLAGRQRTNGLNKVLKYLIDQVQPAPAIEATEPSVEVMEREANAFRPYSRDSGAPLQIGDRLLISGNLQRWVWNGTYWVSERVYEVSHAISQTYNSSSGAPQFPLFQIPDLNVFIDEITVYFWSNSILTLDGTNDIRVSYGINEVLGPNYGGYNYLGVIYFYSYSSSVIVTRNVGLALPKYRRTFNFGLPEYMRAMQFGFSNFPSWSSIGSTVIKDPRITVSYREFLP